MQADKYKVLTIYTMTKFKLNTKQIDPFCVKYQTFDEYIKNGKLNLITLSAEPPKAKRNNFFDIEANNGQATSRHASTRNQGVEIEAASSNPLLTIGDYDNEPCPC